MLALPRVRSAYPGYLECSPGKAEGRTRGAMFSDTLNRCFPMVASPPPCEVAIMVRYRRNWVAGGTYFFTVTLRDRRSDLLVRNVHALRDAWRLAGERIPHTVVAVVVLPEHLHAVIEMRDAHADYPRLWQDIKKGFTRRVARVGERSPWQPRYWEHTIRDEADMRAHVNYIHFNPVKHGWVERVGEWPYSSFHRYVRAGVLSTDWGGVPDIAGAFGER